MQAFFLVPHRDTPNHTAADLAARPRISHPHDISIRCKKQCKTTTKTTNDTQMTHGTYGRKDNIMTLGIKGYT